MGLRDVDHTAVYGWLERAERGDFADQKARGPKELPFSGAGQSGLGSQDNGWFNDGKLGTFIGSGRLPGAKANYHAKAGQLDKNAVVALCMGWIIDNAAQGIIQVAKRDETTGLAGQDIIHPHKLVTLLRKPNPYYSWRVLLSATIVSRKICGYAYWYKLKNGAGQTVGVRWLPPGSLNPVVPKNGIATTTYIDEYIYKVGKLEYTIPADSIVHFRDGISPGNERQGWNRLEAGLRSICSVNEAETYTASILANMGVTPYLFTGMEGGLPLELDDAQSAAMEEEFHGATTSENRGRMMMFKNPVQVTPLGMSPQDMALTNILDRPVSFICSLLRVSPMVVGLPDDQRTYANMGEARSAAHEDCIVPLQDAFADDIDHQLLPEFGNVDTEATTWDRSRTLALQEGEDDRAERATTVWQGGWGFFNEVRQLGNLTPYPGADTLLYVGGQLVDMKQVLIAAKEPPVDEKPEDETEDEDDSADAKIFGLGKKKPKPAEHAGHGGKKPEGHWITTDEGRHIEIGRHGEVLEGGSHIPGIHPGDKPSKPAEHDAKPHETIEATSLGKKIDKEHFNKTLMKVQLKHYDWERGLTKPEKSALTKYQGTEGNFEAVNGSLRSGTHHASVPHIDSALEKNALHADHVVYRAATHEGVTHLNKLQDHELAGAKIHDKGYLSTSLNRKKIEDHRPEGEESASFRIRVPKGTHAAYIDDLKRTQDFHEHEMLLPRGGHLKIHGRISSKTDAQGKPHHFYDAEFVPGDSDAKSMFTGGTFGVDPAPPKANRFCWVPDDRIKVEFPKKDDECVKHAKRKANSDLHGGHWITTDEGRHEYIGGNGNVIAGGSHLPDHTKRTASPDSKVGGPEQAHGVEREKHIVAALGGKHVGRRNGKDQPLDGLVRAGGKRHGIEVKTMSKGNKKNIAMHSDALLRKVKYQDKSPNRVVHTVAVDDRATYGGGKFKEQYSGHQIYYKRGAGAFALSKMHKVKDLHELRSLMHAKHEDLPEAAKHPAGKDWTPKGEARTKLAAQAEGDHSSRLKRQRTQRAEGRGYEDKLRAKSAKNAKH